ncbi:MAG: hypothetical protein IJ575_08185 [Selenomonadaceae bacterium]|nr:hypothetical protein [Selenomonadaceae bacterium]
MEVSKIQNDLPNSIQTDLPNQNQTIVQEKSETRIEESNESPAAEILFGNAKNLGNAIERLEMRERELLTEIQNEVEPDSDNGRELVHLRQKIHEEETIAQE